MRVLCVLVVIAAASPVRAATDTDTGLVIAPGWELARAQCGACHTHAMLTQQRGSEFFWRATIDRMQKHHGLWKIEAIQLEQLVGYLASAYPVANDTDAPGRRPNLTPALRPPPQVGR